MARSRRTSLLAFVAHLTAEKPTRQDLQLLITAAAQDKRLLHVVAWLLFEALADEDKSQLKGELLESWAPTDP